MERTAQEAFITSVNILVFVVALTVSINLMVNVRKMANTANDIMKNEFGSMVETDVDTERILTGQELIYYANDIETNTQYTLYYGNITRKLEEYINTTSVATILNNQYSLSYVGEDKYLIKLK